MAIPSLRADIDFGIWNEETCCGQWDSKNGRDCLFEELMDANIQRLKLIKSNKSITRLPHGFNALKNELSPRKVQYSACTQLLAKKIEEGNSLFLDRIKKSSPITIPAFWEANSVYDEPRMLLAAVPGLTFKELDRLRERSLCCEGGGEGWLGRIFIRNGTTFSWNPCARCGRLRAEDFSHSVSFNVFSPWRMLWRLLEMRKKLRSWMWWNYWQRPMEWDDP